MGRRIWHSSRTPWKIPEAHANMSCETMCDGRKLSVERLRVAFWQSLLTLHLPSYRKGITKCTQHPSPILFSVIFIMLISTQTMQIQWHKLHTVKMRWLSVCSYIHENLGPCPEFNPSGCAFATFSVCLTWQKKEQYILQFHPLNCHKIKIDVYDLRPWGLINEPNPFGYTFNLLSRSLELKIFNHGRE